MTNSTHDPTGPQRDARIAELLHCRQEIDAELAALCGADDAVREEIATHKRVEAEQEALRHDLLVHQSELQAQNEELRRAQEELTAARDRYSDLYDFAPVGYLTVNAAGRLVQVNFTFAGLLGGIERHDLLQQPLLRFIAPESQEDFHFFWLRLEQSGELERVELRLNKADGTTFWAHLDAIVVRQTSASDARELREYRLTVHDITDRKQAEVALREMAVLRESEERFRIMADSAPVIIWVTNAKGDIQFVNLTYSEFFGVNYEQVEGGQWHSLVHPDDAPAYREVFSHSVRAQTPFQAEVRMRRADGAWRWGLSHGEPRFSSSGEFLGHIGIMVDMTERRQAEVECECLLTEVAHQAAELTATFDSIAEGLAIYNLDGTLRYMNTIANRLHGYTPEERALPLEERMRLLRMTRPDGTPVPYEATPHYRAMRGDTVHGEVVGIHRPDSNIWMSISAAPILLQDGTHIGSVITYTDITPLRELQERERRYLYTLAHNLRAPATLIKGNLEVLLEQLQPSDLVVPYRHLVDALQRALFRMSTMIDDFYLVTRLEEGPIPLHPAPVALAPYLHDLLSRYEPVLDTARIHIDLPANLPPVLADPQYLQTIFVSLLGNARKFSAADSPIRIAAHRQDSDVVLSVTDQGIGIAPDDLPHLFERFYRVEHMRRAEGTGLGLYITQRLVEAHGGRLWVESEGGKGSTFFVTLPVG
jgi:PAS domain S-box-containing protein